MGEVHWLCCNGVGIIGTCAFAKEEVKMLFDFLSCFLNSKIIAVTEDTAFKFSLWLLMTEKDITDDVFGQ